LVFHSVRFWISRKNHVIFWISCTIHLGFSALFIWDRPANFFLLIKEYSNIQMIQTCKIRNRYL
jgi:hypothetical protein